MPPFFYTPNLPAPPHSVELDPREAHHATASRRLAIDSPVCLFDGAGNVAHGRIAETNARRVIIRIDRIQHHNPPAPHINLACTLPKGDRQNVLLSMATQLGINAFTPLLCQRSIVKPAASFTNRARRICIEACKQSRRPHLPAIHDPITTKQLAAQPQNNNTAILIAHPGGSPARAAAQNALASHSNVLLMIGPEGGFTDHELAAFNPNNIVSLGDAILRVETAAIALLTLLRLT